MWFVGGGRWITGMIRHRSECDRSEAIYRVRGDAVKMIREIEPTTIDEHRESIRDFLLQINPETGYIGD
ncbi:hypothetical protein BDB13_3392 [Rhodococcus sp. OK302]|nr:hypothetical protein BDB13_3392 [Rhodococcus sp. OK302]